jgi:hypothetical protein
MLSSSFEDPSATIVYPYVYRILNSSTRVGADGGSSNGPGGADTRASSALDSRPISPPRTESSTSFNRHSGSPARTSSSANGHGGPDTAPPTSEPDPDEQLTTIINHISSEKTGAMHKEGITELHQFLKAYPHKKARVDKLLESTGPAFRKYITRALATRAAEDQERDAAVSHTLSSAYTCLDASHSRTHYRHRTRGCCRITATARCACIAQSFKNVFGCAPLTSFSDKRLVGRTPGRRTALALAQHLPVPCEHAVYRSDTPGLMFSLFPLTAFLWMYLRDVVISLHRFLMCCLCEAPLLPAPMKAAMLLGHVC